MAAVHVGKPVVGVLLFVIFGLLDAALAAGGKEVEDILHSFAGEHFDGGFGERFLNLAEYIS